MRDLKVFNVIDKLMMKLEEYILSFSIILISVVIVANIIAREVFNSSFFYWNLEVSKFAIVIATFMGIGYAARKGRHISMSAFYDFAPLKGRKVLAILINGTTAIILLGLAYLSLGYVQAEFAKGTVTPALQIPQYLMVLFIPIGFFLGGIQFLRNMWINIRVKDKVYLGIDAVDYNDKDNKREIEHELPM
ncbi:TRAP-type C4-dicarboxylate transport system, small permease component [Mesobacillus persicus]|uniref:TRAP-type C4-dicarboxylate transport system, small permease component n=1 Tax=Mesobacillus persicus TaxID=930146 RepID=A0A1H8DDQ5_9BACI|nr:TRAP transporter small permease [Mesobacillus persicus]SEN05389.1 TRAP-type C4-dicarboxylate transport system, small permease component [Mesobacillus persicus]